MISGRILALAGAGLLAGCATVIDGTDQIISFSVSPSTANCTIEQNDRVIGSIRNGGGEIEVPKSRNDLTVTCTAPGHQRRTVAVESSVSRWGLAGCFLDLCITDYSTGALNKYDDSVSIRLAQTQTASRTSSGSAASSKAGAKPASRQVRTWRTKSDRVRGYWGGPSISNRYYEIPSDVPLKLVRSDGKWGQYEYTGQNGKPGRVWIQLSDTR